MVQNGKLGEYDLDMNGAFIGYSSRADGNILTIKPKDKKRAITYRDVTFKEVKHGDVYIFPGCAIEHGVCNPQLSIRPLYSKHKYKLAHQQVSAKLYFPQRLTCQRTGAGAAARDRQLRFRASGRLPLFVRI